MEDEGTEWIVKAGPFGITGCGLYLAMLFFGGVCLFVRGIHLFSNPDPEGSRART